MNNCDVIRKLIGPISPIGESNTDRDRLENLKETIDVVNCLLEDIYTVSKEITRYEHSMKLAGKTAKEYLSSIDFYLLKEPQ